MQAERSTIQVDRRQDAAAFSDPDAVTVGNVGVPDCAVGVARNAVGRILTEIGETAPSRQ
jgi:hypothetical protein